MRLILPTLIILTLSAGVALGAPADPDRGFGANGKVVFDFGGSSDDVNAMAVQPDGKIVVAGYTSLKADAAVARLNPDGSPDRGFGVDGVARVESADSEYVEAAAVQPDGKIVIAGDLVGKGNAFVRRLNADGSPDKGFGDQGIAVIDSAGDERADALAIQPDGAIVVVGSTSVAKDIAVYRLTAQGKPDNSFDEDGARGISALGEEWAYAVALQRDGKIVVFGASRTATGGSYPTIARLDGAGKPDTTFGPAGWRTVNENGYFYAGAVQPDGQIVAAGDTWVEDDASVYRFNRDGTPDKSFGGDDGWTAFDLGEDEEAHALALQPDGKIVIAGSTDAGDDAVAWRVTRDGLRDASFGENGAVVVGGHAFEEAVAVGVQRDGKIVLAGDKVGNDDDALVYRLLGDYREPQPGGPGGGQGGPPQRAVRCGGKRATIVGTARRDVLRGTRRADVIAALGGNDTVRGLAGNDVVCGGGGNDRLDGGAGRDRLNGGAGRDRLDGGAGRDRLLGGPGRDRRRG